MGMIRHRLAGYLIAGLLILCACVPLAGAAELSFRDAEMGRKLYTAKCAKCHKFYDPNAYGRAEWETWMTKMRKKSKLKPDQFELLSRYIDTLRTEEKAEIKTK